MIPDTMTFAKAQVVSVSAPQTAAIAGSDTSEQVQTLTADILDGPEKGATRTFQNDYIQLTVGDIFYLRHTTNSTDHTDRYSVADPYRLDTLFYLALGFLVLTFLFGGWQGVRGLAALAGSIALIFFALIPGILAGYSATLVAIGISVAIIILGSYITHGWNRTTTAAVLGMILTVAMTGALAYLSVHAAHLSGYTEEAVYLNFDTRGGIDFVGLLFSGIMIGLLGVLYDIAIGQAIAVEELFRAGLHLTRRDVYLRGLRIGREHIGALINTLAIAYVGVSLPLLLLIAHSSDTGLLFTLNSEIFSTEIIRILIGSIGLVLAVPITTLIASYMLSSVRGTSASAHSHHH